MDNDKFVRAGTPHPRARHMADLLRLAAIASVFAVTTVTAESSVTTREASNRACAGAAGISQRINLSSGVYTQRAVASSPLYLDIPLGTDTHFHEECLRREGFAPREQVSAEFARVAACNRTTNRNVVLVRNSARSVRIANSIDVPAYTRCVDGAISVEAEIPNAAE